MDLRDLPWMPAALDQLDGTTAWILDTDILVFDLPAKGTAVLHRGCQPSGNHPRARVSAAHERRWRPALKAEQKGLTVRLSRAKT